jgi:hypothetical protein
LDVAFGIGCFLWRRFVGFQLSQIQILNQIGCKTSVNRFCIVHSQTHASLQLTKPRSFDGELEEFWSSHEPAGVSNIFVSRKPEYSHVYARLISLTAPLCFYWNGTMAAQSRPRSCFLEAGFRPDHDETSPLEASPSHVTAKFSWRWPDPLPTFQSASLSFHDLLSSIPLTSLHKTAQYSVRTVSANSLSLLSRFQNQTSLRIFKRRLTTTLRGSDTSYVP